MWRIKRICVFEHSAMTKFNCACPAIQRGQGSGLLSEGSSRLTACMSEQRRFWRDARMRRLAWTFAARIGGKYQIRLTRPICSVVDSNKQTKMLSPWQFWQSIFQHILPPRLSVMRNKFDVLSCWGPTSSADNVKWYMDIKSGRHVIRFWHTDLPVCNVWH